MSKRFTVILLLVGLALALLSMGCSTTPSSPTPAPTETESVVIVVVTATSQPVIEATQITEPTITPLATFTPVGFEGATPAKGVTATPTIRKATTAPTTLATVAPAANTPKPVATTKPTATRIPPTTVPLQMKYPAPQPVGPVNVIKNYGNDLEFNFIAVGPLGQNECYLVHLDFSNPSAPSAGSFGDDFLDVPHCGDQSPIDRRLKFTVYRPGFNGPNYGGIEAAAENAAPTAELLQARWYIRIVRNNGPKGDGVHYNTVPLSPNSAALNFTFAPR